MVDVTLLVLLFSKINDSLGVKSGKKNKKLLNDAGLADLGKLKEKSDSSLCSTVKPLKRKRKLSSELNNKLLLLLLHVEL